MSEPFWMIYGEGQREPRYKHGSFLSAKVEAERLARAHPGTPFVILQAVGLARKTDVTYEPIRYQRDLDDDVPF